MFLIGLTGGISSGKSTVSSYLKDLGILVIDADELSRIAVEPGRHAYKQIREVFGSEVFHSDGSGLDRKKLGSIIFADDEKRRMLNSILHPEIRKLMLWRILSAFFQGYQFVVLDVPLLFESKLNKFCHKTVVVYCTEQQQLQRLMKRDNCGQTEAEQRIAAQMNIETKMKLADYVLDNQGDLKSTKLQATDIFRRLTESHWHLVSKTIFTVGLTLVSLVIYHYFNGHP